MNSVTSTVYVTRFIGIEKLPRNFNNNYILFEIGLIYNISNVDKKDNKLNGKIELK